MSEALELINSGALVLQAPEKVIAEAKRAAIALMDVVRAKKKPVIMNGETYLELEDWTLLGRFFNSTPKVRSTNYVEYGDVKGFEAVADVITLIDGQPVVIVSADSMTLSDEDNWGDRPKYEWQEDLDKDGKIQWVDGDNGKKRPKKKKVKIGAEPTPLFQLRSMAQTRACAKALRLAYSWVVVLANNDGAKLSTTPAEEMGGTTIEGGTAEEAKPAVAEPKRQDRSGVKISEGQRKRMYAMAREAGFDADTRVKEVITAYGYAHADDVVRGKEEGFYDHICKALVDKTWKPPAAAPAAKASLTPVTIEGKCNGITEIPADGDKDAFIVLTFGEKEVHCFDYRQFDLLKTAVDKDCKLNCGMKEGFPNKVKLLKILKVGDKEWLEDGTPVIQQNQQ